MPDKLQEFVRETKKELLRSMTPEEIVEGRTSEELTRMVRAFPREMLEKELLERASTVARPKPQ